MKPPRGVLLYVAIGLFVYFLVSRIVYKNLEKSDDQFEYVKNNEPPKLTSSCGTHLKGEDCNRMVERLHAYCASEKPMGSEGIHGGVPTHDYKLKYVTLTIRHGDRSTLNFIPGSYRISPLERLRINDSTYLPHNYDPEAIQHLHKLNNFKVVDLPNDSPGVKVQHAATEAFRTYDTLIGPGQLTTTGFMQHIKLGKHLQESYKPVLEKIDSPRDIYVRSTNYDRTIQSAIGLISSMLPNIGGPEEIHKIGIKVYRDEGQEIMHGVGMRLSSKTANGSGDELHQGSCKQAFISADNERKSFITSSDLTDRISSMFSPEAIERPITDIADAALPGICHNEPLPCAANQSRGCMSIPLLASAMSESDRYFCNRYTGIAGGEAATKLSLYPLMAEILKTLETASEASPEKPMKDKMTILSGHDTVIAPVLATLGVYKSHCWWPPYASRIAFELWEHDAGDSAPSGSRHLRASASNPDESFVRVVFNGKDVTATIPSCQGLHMCPLAAFKLQIDSLLGPFKTLEEACA